MESKRIESINKQKQSAWNKKKAKKSKTETKRTNYRFDLKSREKVCETLSKRIDPLAGVQLLEPQNLEFYGISQDFSRKPWNLGKNSWIS